MSFPVLKQVSKGEKWCFSNATQKRIRELLQYCDEEKKNVCWLNIKVKIAHEQTIAKPLPNKKSLKVTFLKTKDGIQVTSWALPLHVDICSIECISAMAISVITIIYYLFSTYRENDYFKTFSAVFDKHSLDSNNFLKIY